MRNLYEPVSKKARAIKHRRDARENEDAGFHFFAAAAWAMAEELDPTPKERQPETRPERTTVKPEAPRAAPSTPRPPGAARVKAPGRAGAPGGYRSPRPRGTFADPHVRGAGLVG